MKGKQQLTPQHGKHIDNLWRQPCPGTLIDVARCSTAAPARFWRRWAHDGADVGQWLDSLGLGQYAEAFEENAITWATLPELDHELLKEVQCGCFGVEDA